MHITVEDLNDIAALIAERVKASSGQDVTAERRQQIADAVEESLILNCLIEVA
ncbi:hypothetical protein FHR99_003171 [Litorivivens lipolytica]|uniref:Uncharacterized protein n=1 Tax=Litorivivens lipolytica TaxID=1524264 RepID=A0A7W4W8Q9_9GAMM|nr:hypothetical protein [Litorivivens lipolytica]MBB3048897.1 hypothetical protein [Litorivivens lipolytica]